VLHDSTHTVVRLHTNTRSLKHAFSSGTHMACAAEGGSTFSRQGFTSTYRVYHVCLCESGGDVAASTSSCSLGVYIHALLQLPACQSCSRFLLCSPLPTDLRCFRAPTMLLKYSRLSCASMASSCCLRSVYAAVLSRLKTQPAAGLCLLNSRFGVKLRLVWSCTPRPCRRPPQSFSRIGTCKLADHVDMLQSCHQIEICMVGHSHL
jgi:hypothetical protein